MSTHAVIFKSGKYWFTQHWSGHPDYTGKLLISLRDKFGEITSKHIHEYFAVCGQKSGEYEYDIREDGIYWRVSPDVIVIEEIGSPVGEPILNMRNVEDSGTKWKKLTKEETGDYQADKFLTLVKELQNSVKHRTFGT